MKKTFTILVALLLGLTTAFGQGQKAGVSFQLGGILPTHQFKSIPSLYAPGFNSFGENGGAMFGASFGLKFTYAFRNTALEDSGLGIFLAGDAMWNSLDKSIREMYDKVSCTKPMYINVPIILGVNYTLNFGNVFGIWVEGGIGADLFFKTPEGWENRLTEYKMGAEFASQVGAGILLARTVSLGAHYYWLGTQDVRPKPYNILYPNSQMKIGVWAFKLGFHF